MIGFKLELHNPWPFKWSESFDLWIQHWRLSEHKSLEIQLAWWDRKDTLGRIEVDAPLRGQDHAGIRIEIGLLGLDLMLNLYDSRHWDYERETWQRYEEGADVVRDGAEGSTVLGDQSTTVAGVQEAPRRDRA